jgi:hypothetical protein
MAWPLSSYPPISRRAALVLVVGLLSLSGSRDAHAQEVAGCAIFPADSIWNARVDSLPLDSASATYVDTIGADANLHPDFGSGEWPFGSGSPIGIPYVVVPASQPQVPVTFLYDDESDPGPYPIPPDAPIEGRSRHLRPETRNLDFGRRGGSAHPARSGAV